jgi:hypothetical protein
MPTSGTVSQTPYPTSKIVEQAYRKCGLAAPSITAEMAAIARDNMYLLTREWANRGLNLWVRDKILVGTVQGQQTYVLPAGTIDVMEMILRTPSAMTGTTTSTVSSITLTPTSSAQAQMFGVNILTSGTYDLVFEYTTDNISWNTASAPGSASYGAGWAWFEATVVRSAVAFRVRESTGLTINTWTFYVANLVSDIPMYRFNVDDYTSLANKYAQGRPVNFFMERFRTPQVTLWQVPDATTYVLVIWRHRHMQDITLAVNDVEVPERWLPALVADLAWRVGKELPRDMRPQPAELADLKSDAAEAIALASAEERDASEIRINANIGAYTR